MHCLFVRLKRYLVVSLCLCVMGFIAPLTLAQTTIFEEDFNSGLGSFSSNGRVYTGSYGVRLRGGDNSVITSNSISLANFSNIRVSYERSTSGLDSGESFTAAYAVNGGGFVTLESNRTASGRTTINLPAGVSGQSIVLRFSLNASSFFETLVVDDIVVEGTGGGGPGPGPGPGPGSCGELPAVNRIDTNGPFQTTQHRNAGPGGGWVVHPSNMDSNGLCHAIFVWGPGAGTGPSNYDFFLDRIASHGFVVYSEVSTGNGSEMEDAIDWLIAENSRPGSRYFQKLNTNKIAIGGHSRGSLSAFGVADDSRLTTTVHVAGGSFDGRGPNSLRKPTIYIAGENDTLATGNMERDYANTNVPVFFTIIDNVSHTAAARQGMPAIVAWLRWQLGGENFRCGDFLDPFCDFCTGVYDSESKNW